MRRQANDRQQQLTDAFEAFSQVSSQLESAYRELEDRVADLNRELAAARSERLRQLAEKERIAGRLQRLLELLPGGVVVLDGAGCVQDCNPAARELLGEPLLGETWHQVTARAFAPEHDDTHDVTLRGGRRVSISTRALEGEPGRILLLHDVTETRALQDQVARQQRLTAMGEMTASLAHQLRTPLSGALLYGSQLAGETLGDRERARFAAKLVARLRQLEAMVNDMLVFTRGGAGGDEAVPVAALLADLEAALEPQLAQAGARLEVIDAAPTPVLRGNRQALLGALCNLAGNAMAAAGAAARIVIHAAPTPAGDLCIAVEDNGPGVPAAIRERVFEPFFTTRSNGTGLGLAVVRAVVEAHRGEVRLDEAAAGGARFELRFPATILETPLASGARRPVAAGAAGR